MMEDVPNEKLEPQTSAKREVINEHNDVIQYYLRTVGFIYKSEDVSDGVHDMVQPKGTCFFYQTFEEGHRVPGNTLLITNKHVLQIEKRHDSDYMDSILVRTNNIENSQSTETAIKLILEGPEQNTFPHPTNSVDLAAVLLEKFNPSGYTRLLNSGSLATEDEFAELNFSEGTGVFTVGYLFGYAGIEKNYPIILSGKQCLVTKEQWFKSNRNPSEREQAFISQLPVANGSSGSPVMLDPINSYALPNMHVVHETRYPMVIGIIKASMNETWDFSVPGRPVRLSQGLAAIEPVQNLIDLIENTVIPSLKALGKESVMEMKEFREPLS